MRTMATVAITFQKGILEWFTTVDHKRIGLMYLVVGLLAFLVGGAFALILRTELISGTRFFNT